MSTTLFSRSTHIALSTAVTASIVVLAGCSASSLRGSLTTPAPVPPRNAGIERQVKNLGDKDGNGTLTTREIRSTISNFIRASILFSVKRNMATAQQLPFNIDSVPSAKPFDVNSDGTINRTDSQLFVAALQAFLANQGTCGDGTWNAGEECDDRNTTAGDGCSASCAIESGYSCTSTTGQQSQCVSTADAATYDAVKVLADTDQSGGISADEADAIVVKALTDSAFDGSEPYDQVKKYDVNNDGKADIDDIIAIVEELEKDNPTQE